MKSLQEQKGRRALKLLQRIPGCAISVCWEETQLASCRDLTSHVCKKMRKSWTKHSPKMHNCREQSRGACQTTQHILSCLRNPATAQVQGKRQTHSESHHSPVNRGPDSCLTAYWASSYSLAAQYASEHWNALVVVFSNQRLPFAIWAEPAESLDAWEKAWFMWHGNEGLWELRSPGLHQTLSPAGSQGRRIWDFISWHPTTVWGRKSFPLPPLHSDSSASINQSRPWLLRLFVYLSKSGL